MIAERFTFPVKLGHEEEILKLCYEVRDIYEKKNIPFHIYTPLTGTFGIIVVEWEYESISHWDKDTQEFAASPEWAELLPKFGEHLEHGGYSRELMEIR